MDARRRLAQFRLRHPTEAFENKRGGGCGSHGRGMAVLGGTVHHRDGFPGVLLICSFVSTAIIGGASLGSTSASAAGARYYLALGDSVPVWDGMSSYPYLIGSHYGIPKAGIVDIACSGATTMSMISGPACTSLPGGRRLASQLREAVYFLQKHHGAVTLITIDIGGNVFLKCAVRTGINLACVKNVERTTGSNLKSIPDRSATQQERRFLS